MFKNVFMSEFSFSNSDDIQNILKSHLLTNEKVVIPASTINKTELGKVLSNNIKELGGGAIRIAHGNDISDLTLYPDKYPNILWTSDILSIFDYFNKHNFCEVYKTEQTISQFNELMKKCAQGKIPQFEKFFSNKVFCDEVLNFKNNFNLNEYFEIINQNILEQELRSVLESHAKYHYNYFGSYSTNSGNSYCIENAKNYNHINFGNMSENQAISGLSILISSALDFTDGIEDFDFISDLDENFLSKLEYKDILDIRQSWLHGRLIEKYEKIVEECSSSYVNLKSDEVDKSISHIENAYQIRSDIFNEINSSVQKEVLLYKFFRFSNFLSNTAISNLSFLSPITFPISVAQGIYSAATEIAVLINKEKQLKNAVESKLTKFKLAYENSKLFFGLGSPVTEYLEMINKKLDE